MFTGRMERSRDRGWRDDFRDRDRSREDVAGPIVPLTEENLARQQLRGAESSIHVYKIDSKKAVTSDTSPSVSSEENVTIRVTGDARVVIENHERLNTTKCFQDSLSVYSCLKMLLSSLALTQTYPYTSDPSSLSPKSQPAN
jgi:hypothetical protein